MSNADRSWPLDALGNTLKKGDLVRASLQSPALNFRVVDVRPASTVLATGPEGALAMPGEIVLIATVPVQFVAGSQLADVYKLKEPEQESTLTKQ
jgi:hypothetical protein